MSVKVGHFDVSGGSIDGLNYINDLPWKPQAAIFWCVDMTADGYESDADFAGFTGFTALSIGLATDDGTQGCQITSSAPMAFAPFNNSGNAMFTDRVVVCGVNGSSAAIPGDFLAINSWDPCGWHFGITGTHSYRVYYVAFAGVTLNRASGTLTFKADGTDTSVTGFPFTFDTDPDLLFFIGGQTGDEFGGQISFGFASGVGAAHQRASTYTIYYNARGGTAGGPAQGMVVRSPSWAASLASFDTDGFTITPLDAFNIPATDQTILWMALSDVAGGFNVLRQLWPDPGPDDSDSLGFQPEALITCGGIISEPGSDIDGQLCIGASDGVNSAVAASGVENMDDQRRWRAQETDTGRLLLDYEGNAAALTGYADLISFNADTFTWDGLYSGANVLVGFAAIKTSEVAASDLCGKFVPQIYRRLPVAT